MYRVTMINDGASTVISEPNSSELKLSSGKINRKVNAIDSFTFTANIRNPAWDNAKPLKTLIKVVNTLTGKQEFLGRVLKPKKVMSTSGEFLKTFECEGELAYLHDSVQRHGEYHNLSPAEYLAVMLNAHNSQVDSDKRIYIGKVTVTNSTDNLYRYLSYDDTWESIIDDLVNSLGGYIVLRYKDGLRYLDYLSESGVERNMSISLAKNMLSVEHSVQPDEVITKLIPLGERIESEDETAADASQARLTISSANGGRDYLIDTEWVNEFGTVEGTVIWDDVTTASNLMSKGSAWLKAQRVPETISLSALNLSLIDENYEDFNIGDYYKTDNAVLGLNEYYQLTEMSIDIFSPQIIDVTFGDRTLTLTQYQKVTDDSKSTEKALAALNKKLYTASSNITILKNEIESLQTQVNELAGGGGGETESTIGWEGCDISYYQGATNFTTMRNKGMRFAMVRAGYRGYETGTLATDSMFTTYVPAAANAGFRVGLYFFSQATSQAEGIAEAQHVLNLISNNGFGSYITFPIAIDIENSTGYPSGRADSNSASTWGAVARGFADTIKAAGYTPIIYANRSYLTSRIDLTQVSDVDVWLAHYTDNINSPSDYSGSYTMWQWTSTARTGTDYGVSTTGLDFNLCYKNY